MDKEELKKRVRALLISSKQGCTPNSLLKDYRSVFGEGLPLNEFGYRSVVAMAEDMPDVVRIQGGGGGYGVLLRGVADESTRHIAKMVSRQRNTGYHQIKPEQQARKTVNTPSIPFHIQGCFRQLMHAYPNGLPIEQFEEAYARRFGYYLALRRLKCNTLQELVNNVPDVLKTVKDSAGRTFIIEASRTSHDSVPSRPNRLLNQPRNFEGQSIMRISDQLSSYDDTSPSSEDSPKVHDSQPSISYSTANGNAHTPSVPVPTTIRENILKLLHSKHLGIWCMSLQAEYKIIFGKPLDLGPFRNIMELLSNMKDVCIMEKPNVNSGDWLVRSREQPPKGVVLEEESEPSGDMNPPGNIKEHIAKLMLDHPAGIQLQELPVLFKQKYKFELPVEKLGFGCIASLVNSISDVVKKVIQNGQLLILPVTKGSSAGNMAWSNTNGSVENESALKANEVVETDGAPMQKKTTPKKATLSSISVDPVMSSEYIALVLPQSTSTINVTVSHAINPSKFFIQIIGKDHSHMLNTLMITISKFYCSVTGVEKAIARPMLGQACCALFDGDGCWYRAEIVGIPTPFTVLVKYVDYGNICELPIGSVRKPQPEFLMLPAQSLECSLADVKPKERVWSEDACKVFQDAVNEKPLVAFIQQPVTSHPLRITLCDTSTKEDVYIHELLISKGLACVVEHEQAPPQTSSEAFMLSQFKEQFYTLQQTLLLQQQMLQQQLMASGQLRQNGQVNGKENASTWQPQSIPTSQGSTQPPATNTSSEHRKKMAAAKDIWSSDSETEDEKSELNSSENITKQLETKLERLNEERRNILERMTYNSSSGSISSWVEKLQNIEGTIKATQESLKRRANGLPPLPPPGLSHMQPAKQSHQAEKPKGVTGVNKPIIGLGRGKRFSKQNSLPSGIGETTTPTSVSGTPVGETAIPSSSNNGMLAHSQFEKSRLCSDSEVFSHDQSKKQQLLTRSGEFGNSHLHQLTRDSEIISQDHSKSQQHVVNNNSESGPSYLQQCLSGSEGFNQNQPKKQEVPSNNEVFCDSQLQTLVGTSDILNHDQHKKEQMAKTDVLGQSKLSINSEIFEPMAKKQQMTSKDEVFSQSKLSNTNGALDHEQPKKQYQMAASSSKVCDQKPSSSSEKLTQKLGSNKSEEPLQEHLSSITPKQITKPLSKLSLVNVNASPFTPSLVNSTTVQSPSSTPTKVSASSFTTQVSTPVVSSRSMSYSSAVTSQLARKPHPHLIRPQQQQPYNRMPVMYQQHPPPLMTLPPYGGHNQPPPYGGHNQPPVVGLGRGVDPWLTGPPPNSRGGKAQYMPPPVHYNFEQFYEIPSSGLHNPFYPIPPMGSSSGLDII